MRRKAKDVGAGRPLWVSIGRCEARGGRGYKAAEAPVVREGTIVEARGLRPLVVVEDVRPLAAESEVGEDLGT